jgi:hypothetical protein
VIYQRLEALLLCGLTLIRALPSDRDQREPDPLVDLAEARPDGCEQIPAGGVQGRVGQPMRVILIVI